jgi:hypothetical protein
MSMTHRVSITQTFMYVCRALVLSRTFVVFDNIGYERTRNFVIRHLPQDYR